MAKIVYWCNLNLRDKYFGYKPTDELVYVGEVETDGLNDAYRRFNRVEEPTPELDEAGAPSMSVGDVAHIRDTDEWFAVASLGFDRIEQPNDKYIVTSMGKQWVAKEISKMVDKINRDG